MFLNFNFYKKLDKILKRKLYKLKSLYIVILYLYFFIFDYIPVNEEFYVGLSVSFFLSIIFHNLEMFILKNINDFLEVEFKNSLMHYYKYYVFLKENFFFFKVEIVFWFELNKILNIKLCSNIDNLLIYDEVVNKVEIENNKRFFIYKLLNIFISNFYLGYLKNIFFCLRNILFLYEIYFDFCFYLVTVNNINLSFYKDFYKLMLKKIS